MRSVTKSRPSCKYQLKVKLTVVSQVSNPGIVYCLSSTDWFHTPPSPLTEWPRLSPLLASNWLGPADCEDPHRLTGNSGPPSSATTPYYTVLHHINTTRLSLAFYFLMNNAQLHRILTLMNNKKSISWNLHQTLRGMKGFCNICYRKWKEYKISFFSDQPHHEMNKGHPTGFGFNFPIQRKLKSIVRWRQWKSPKWRASY